MVDRFVAVDDGDYRLPQPVLQALASDLGDPATDLGASIARGYGTTLHAPAHGVIGDGVTNDAGALQALLNTAATFGASVTLAAGSTLLLDATIAVPSGTRLDLNGSTMRRGPSGSNGLLNLTGSSGVSNHRQGMSVIAVDGLTATSSCFTNTAGAAPESGVDVEPNNPDQVVRNVRFVGCTMTGNAGHGYLEVLVEARTVYQGDVTLTACNVDDNAIAGVRLTESQDFQMIGGSASRNFVGVRHDTRKVRNAQFTNVTIQGNDQHGVGFTANYDELAFTACSFKNNGATTAGDGLNIAPAGTSTALRFIGNFSGGSPQRNGITLGANVSGAAYIANQYAGNTGTARSGTSVITLDLDSIGKRTVTGSRGGNAAVASLLTQLAGAGLIVDSTTA